MAAKRSAISPQISTVQLVAARQTIASAFAQCLSEVNASHDTAARMLGITKRTVGAWVRCESPISVERVLASPQLTSAFRQALCVHNHEERTFLPLILRAPRRSKSKRGSK